MLCSNRKLLQKGRERIAGRGKEEKEGGRKRRRKVGRKEVSKEKGIFGHNFHFLALVPRTERYT